MNLFPLPAFQDNVLHNGHGILSVDPGDAQPVLTRFQRDGLQLEAILVKHHRADHIGRIRAPGVDVLRPGEPWNHEFR